MDTTRREKRDIEISKKNRFVNFVKDGEKRRRQFRRRAIVGNPRVILIDSLGNPRVILIDSLIVGNPRVILIDSLIVGNSTHGLFSSILSFIRELE